MRIAAHIVALALFASTALGQDATEALLAVMGQTEPDSGVAPMFQFRASDAPDGVFTQWVANVGAYYLSPGLGEIGYSSGDVVRLTPTNYLSLSSAIQPTTNMCVLQVVKFDGVSKRRVMLGTVQIDYVTAGYGHTDNTLHVNIGNAASSSVGGTLTNNSIWFLMTACRDATSQWVRINGSQVGNRVGATNISKSFLCVGRRGSFYNGTNAWVKEIVGYTNADSSSAAFYEAREAELNATYSIY